MQVWNGLESIVRPFLSTSVAIGVFDGIHVGHQALISKAVADARANHRPAVVFTFDRHPMELIAPERAPGVLTTPEQREKLLAEQDVDHLVIAQFDDRFRQLSPESFLRFVAKGVLGIEAVFVGMDFRFGCNQLGNVEYLRESQPRFGFRLSILEPVIVEGERASSSRIRRLLKTGDIPGAASVLGHSYGLSGVVVEGDRLGRTLGWPTANIHPSFAQVIPADGIYAGWVPVDGKTYKAACSIGIRPTVGGTERTIEAYLLGFSGDLYGREIEIEFVKRIRDELKFDSLDSLKSQIGRDVADVDSMLHSKTTEVSRRQGRVHAQN